MENEVYDMAGGGRPFYFSEEAAEEFAAVASSGMVEKIISSLDWRSSIPLIAGALPQYGECAVLFPEKFTSADPVEGGYPVAFFLLEARTLYPEVMLDVFSRCAASLRCGGRVCDGFKIVLADTADGIAIKRDGIFTELKMRIKVIVSADMVPSSAAKEIRDIPADFLLNILAEKKGFTVGGVPELPVICRRMELVRSEMYPLSNCQRITVRICIIDTDPSAMEFSFEESWQYGDQRTGMASCIFEGAGSKTDFKQENFCGVMMWRKSFYAEYLFDLADTVYYRRYKSGRCDYSILQNDLQETVGETVHTAGYLLAAGECGITVRFSGLSDRMPEFVINGLFADYETALKTASDIVNCLIKSGRWGVSDVSAAAETSSGRRCWSMKIMTSAVI